MLMGIDKIAGISFFAVANFRMMRRDKKMTR